MAKSPTTMLAELKACASFHDAVAWAERTAYTDSGWCGGVRWMGFPSTRAGEMYSIECYSGAVFDDERIELYHNGAFFRVDKRHWAKE